MHGVCGVANRVRAFGNEHRFAHAYHLSCVGIVQVHRWIQRRRDPRQQRRNGGHRRAEVPRQTVRKECCCDLLLVGILDPHDRRRECGQQRTLNQDRGNVSVKDRKRRNKNGKGWVPMSRACDAVLKFVLGVVYERWWCGLPQAGSVPCVDMLLGEWIEHGAGGANAKVFYGAMVTFDRGPLFTAAATKADHALDRSGGHDCAGLRGNGSRTGRSLRRAKTRRSCCCCCCGSSPATRQRGLGASRRRTCSYSATTSTTLRRQQPARYSTLLLGAAATALCHLLWPWRKR